MKRLTRIVVGASLAALFFVWIYVRDHSALATHFPTDEPVRFVVNLIAWGSLLGGAAVIGSAWVKSRDVQRDEGSS